MAMNLKNELKAVEKQLQALTKKVEKMLAAVETTEKPKAAQKAPAKAPAKKTNTSSAIDAVIGVIKRSKKAIDIETLKTKTGLQGQKLHNIVYILKKQGKIKSAGKGVYVKA